MSIGLSHSFHVTPRDGLAGLKQNWKNDLIAAFSVALVALPLGLIISLASGAPPMAGIISASIGAIVATFIRGSHLVINGPGNTLILVVASAIVALNDTTAAGDIINFSGLKYCLAAFICAGAIQILFGLLKIGRYSDFIPNSVIYGLLAAIGVMILGKQLHTAIGVVPTTGTDEALPYLTGIKSIDYIIELPHSFIVHNPIIGSITAMSLLVMVLHPRVKSKIVHFVPASIWVILFTIPLVYAFNLFESHEIKFAGSTHIVGPQHLAKVDSDIMSNLFFPDFGKATTMKFWLIVGAIVMISTVETLSSAKAVEKLDPYRRKVNKNKDLIAVGVATIAACSVGGLPVVNVIARSSININNGAKTRWSNFFHGVILTLFVLLLTPVINLIPHAALASILIYTGYKLTSPIVFRDVARKGKEQLIIMVFTFLSTLTMGLITGLAMGIVFTMLVQIVQSRMSIVEYFTKAKKLDLEEVTEANDELYIRVKGVSSFMNLLALIKRLSKLPKRKSITIGFANAELVDHTVLEYVHEFADKYNTEGGKLSIVGLGVHSTSSSHPYALHYLRDQVEASDVKRPKRLTKRQLNLQDIANGHKWQFEPGLIWDFQHLRDFLFFEMRPIEYRSNVIKGTYAKHNVEWEVSDLAFDEGVFQAHEEYHTTVQKINLPVVLPRFSLEQEVFFDKILGYAGYENIDYKTFTDFSDKFVIKAHNRDYVSHFFTEDVVKFLEEHDIYHLECIGNSIVVFKHLRLANPVEIEQMVQFSEEFVELISTRKGKE